ncbi:ATP-binding protein [Haemophilus parainfluenzae]|uniref:Histidine kinase n=1 Tax=Haemophilus parainfluenzae TaxID=729 RepID=A0A377JI35_HAEPA|nr:ATP-binding protein [Haemophilus parainfluenzae]STP05393.1 histidine kinase [Haemophilus parainfluenzae]
MSENAYKIRPAGRHLLTIGRDLIQDSYAAIVELVKNAYDADSESVEIHFKATEKTSENVNGNAEKRIEITVRDYGHGMSQDTVINKWMVPSTPDKLERRKSPHGRIMQGRKGIGRYAASMLGSTLLLETVSKSAEKTTVLVDWHDFETSKYLDDVELLVETHLTDELSGTTLTIEGGEEYYSEWNGKQFKDLNYELKKLISPVQNSIDKAAQAFQIHLKISGFSDVEDLEEIIAPYPIFDLFDYKISGRIHSNGKGILTYALQKARNTVEEVIPFDLKGYTACGDLIFDIRVYDREKESIEQLIHRGLKDDHGNYLGKLQARKILNDSNGIGVYRNGFRIRPLGDPEFDWLKLNEQRVQNPSLKIGSNQVIGYVLIDSEEKSDLIEKSARDGLRDNNAYKQLQKITNEVIKELEIRRFSYRRKAGLSKPALKVEKELNRIFSFDNLKQTVHKKLIAGGMNEKSAEEVIELISKEEEEKSQTVEEIRQAIATYQGQATLGKIMNVVLHEGRRPLNYFRNEVPRIDRFIKKYKETSDFEHIETIESIAHNTVSNAKTFSDLFLRLDPLAMGKRPAKRQLSIENEISNCFAIFRQQMEDKGIKFKISGSAIIEAWQQDIAAIFTNLIENSIFWLSEKNTDIKEVMISIITEKNSLSYIDFRDTGPGIESNLIEDNLIFEPQFSTKPGVQVSVWQLQVKLLIETG